MSQYFARLAQRSGFAPPIAPARTEPAPDIVEHDVQIDAPATPAFPSETALPVARNGAPAAAAPMTNARTLPAREQTAASAPHTEAVSTGAQPSAPTTIAPVPRAAQDTPTAAYTAEYMAAAPAPTIQPSRPAAVRDIVEEDGIVLPSANAIDAPMTKQPSRSASALPEKTSVRNAGNARVARERTRRSIAESISLSPQSTAQSPILSSLDAPMDRLAAAESPRRADAREETTMREIEIAETHASGVSRVQSAKAPANDVSVRIGAVRLEIHAPAPVAPPASMAPVSAAPLPRFSPRRHYLRG